MKSILSFLQSYGTQISALGAASAFIFGVYKYYLERKTALFWKEFEVYHKLVKELVSPDSEVGSMYIDRQAAIIYELRNFKRYYPYSLRMLLGLKEKWGKAEAQYPRLIEEIDLAVEFLQKEL